MKKITLIAALIGSAYFANAQVGIGTSSPLTSANLDVTASDKGVLIPRVSLTSTAVFSPIQGVEAESLLVYNTASVGDVKPGFYYWVVKNGTIEAHWERIVNATDLENAIGTIGSDFEKIKELLNTAFPSNNLGDTNVNGGVQGDGLSSGGGMVFTPSIPANGTNAEIPAKIDYVYYDQTANNGQGGYVKHDITDVIGDMISAQESKTSLVKNTDDSKQYYISESFLVGNGGVAPTQAAIDGWGIAPPAGVYYVDVVGGVINNIENIMTTPTTIQIIDNGVTHNFNTVQEYIEYISTNSNLPQGTVTAEIDPTSGDVTFNIANGDGTSTAILIDAFDTIVTTNETKTTITRSENGLAYAAVTADPIAADVVAYKYAAEDGVTNYINVTEDVLFSIVNNQEIRNEISNILNAGGSVYFGDHDNNASTADVLFTQVINADGTVTKTPIDIAGTLIQNTTISTTNTTVQNETIQKNINNIKNNLGNSYTEGVSVFTGDTFVDGTTKYYLYRGEFTTTISANTANTTGVVLDRAANQVTAMNLKYGMGMTASITDLALTGSNIAFKIGVGKMYNVIGTADVSAKVMVEFYSTVAPLGL